MCSRLSGYLWYFKYILSHAGTSKLDLKEGKIGVYTEDRTEIDDDECLLAHDAGTVFLLGNIDFKIESALSESVKEGEQPRNEENCSQDTKRTYEETSKQVCGMYCSKNLT